MGRVLGIFLLVVVLYAVLFVSNPKASSQANLGPMAISQGYFGIITLGAAVVIIAGGIDLSIGSVVGLCAVLFYLLLRNGVPPLLAVPIILAAGTLIGMVNGLLITKLRLQPFLVTLCGMFAYRGLAQYASDKDVGLGHLRRIHKDDPAMLDQLNWLEWVANGTIGESIPIPVILLLLLVLGVGLGVFLHASVYGRYLFAIGGNEQAARYAGIPTDRYKILAYSICATLAALGGMLELLQVDVSPSKSGNFYELYAITGAVLGGCSLSGGEGNILGILLGVAVLPLLKNLTRWYPEQIPESLQATIIGVVLLLGTIADEWFKRRAARRG